jgi:glycosyltransferase involved in cell wall biosynthesis
MNLINPPKISVIIFSYNFEQFIDECIQSILKQTLTPYEIIICDDHSTDESWEIISNYGIKDPELLRTFRHDQNIGMINNCNFGFKQARGDFISWLDGDDMWLPQKLELEWQTLNNNPLAKLAYSNVITIDEAGNQIDVWIDPNESNPPEGDVFVPVFAKRFFRQTRSVFRNELIYRDIYEVLKRDPEAGIYSDWDSKIRVTAEHEVAYSGKGLVLYRIHDQGIHRKHRNQIFESANNVINKNIHLLESRSADEQKFVIDNLKTLLVQEYNYSKNIQLKSKEEIHIKENEYRGVNLIFLISQPRAGSTLLQRILAGHSEIQTTAEPWIMLHPLYAIKKNGLLAEFDSNLARQGLEDFLSQVPEGQELYFKALRNMGGTLYNRVLEVSGKRFFLDKTPRYHFIVPELKKVFPEAKFIFLLRNPLAILSSTLKTWFQNNPENLQKSPNYLDVIQGPLNLIRGIQILNEKDVVVKYEELVEDAETTVKAICYKLGINFQQEMLTYGNKPKPEGRFGDSVGIVKHNNAVPYYLDQWAENLQSTQLNEFSLKYMKTLGPEVFNLMGYPYEENKSKLVNLENQTQVRDEQTIETSNQHNETCSPHQVVEDQIKTLETILKQNPNAAQSHNDLGVLYYRSGEKGKVLFHYQEAVRLNPDNIIFAKNLADFYYVEMKNIETALQIYNKVLQIAPYDTETLIILGLICEDSEKFEDAKNFYIRVLECDPHNQEAHHHLNKLGNRNLENKLQARI